MWILAGLGAGWGRAPALRGFRRSLFRWRLGMGAGGAGVPALPRPVVGVSPAAGDKPQPYIRSAALPAAGDECRRCRVPALPRSVVGVSPAAGDKPQPYIRSAALPPAAGDEGRPYRGRRCRRRRGMRAGVTLGRWSLFRWRLGMGAGVTGGGGCCFVGGWG